MIRAVRISCAAAALGVPSAAGACQVNAFNFAWGSDSSTHMAARSTEACLFGFRVSSRGHMDGVAVVQPPQHGTLTQVDPTHWMYHPARGYTGPDSIAVRASGNQMYSKHVSSGTTNITWAVDVAP